MSGALRVVICGSPRCGKTALRMKLEGDDRAAAGHRRFYFPTLGIFETSESSFAASMCEIGGTFTDPAISPEKLLGMLGKASLIICITVTAREELSWMRILNAARGRSDTVQRIMLVSSKQIDELLAFDVVDLTEFVLYSRSNPTLPEAPSTPEYIPLSDFLDQGFPDSPVE